MHEGYIFELQNFLFDLQFLNFLYKKEERWGRGGIVVSAMALCFK